LYHDSPGAVDAKLSGRVLWRLEDHMTETDPAGAQETLRIAVVGAGIGGLTAARELAGAGHEVVVFERGRGPGGRASRRRAEGFEFDHGAQYFTARAPAFLAQTRAWLDDGIAAEWAPRMATAGDGGIRGRTSRTTRYVGTPGMSALARERAASLDLRTGVRVTALSGSPGSSRPPRRWTLELEHAAGAGGAGTEVTAPEVTAPGPFDAVLLACTPAQGLPLLDRPPDFSEQARAVRFLPVWALLLGFETPPDIQADGVFVDDPVIAWAARNDSKPGRRGGPTWVVHATGKWSAGREEEPAGEIAEELCEGFERALGLSLPAPTLRTAHRWRYARCENPLGVGALWDEDLRIGMCGDWCTGSRIEGAYQSGRALAARILDGETRRG
jgi:hypothetical protein